MTETIELDESCSHTNPQTALLISLYNDNLEEFQHNLHENSRKKYYKQQSLRSVLSSQRVSIDVNHRYADADNESLLEIACSCKHKTKFVELLLQHGANVNLLNPFNGKAPIHLAVLYSDYSTLKMLVENENIDINKPDTSGHTALYLASQKGRVDFVNLLRQHMASEEHDSKSDRMSINIDPKDEEGSLSQDPDHPNPTNNRSIDDNPDLQSSADRLFSLLKDRNYEAFASEANKINVRHVKRTQNLTYLQFASKVGLTSFVRLLLDLEVDPNETSLASKQPPIMLAAYNRHYDVVKMLTYHQNIDYCLVHGDNILHAMFFAEMINYRLLGESHSPTFGSKHQNFYKCLKHLLTNVPKSHLDVNLLNRRGETVLHYAVLTDNRDVIRLLVEKGAHIGIANAKGETPVKFMKAATLEYFLDTAISSKGHLLERDHQIILDYNFLKGNSFDSPFFTQTKPLVAISEVPHLRPLLKHPFFTVFLDLKWYIFMKKLTLVNYFFYTLFVLSLSCYLLMDYVPIPTELVVAKNSTEGYQNNTPTVFQNKTTPLHMYTEKYRLKEIETILWYIVVILNSIIFLREFLQFVTHSNSNKYRYIKNPENWIEVALIAVTFVILFAQIDSTENRSRLSVTAIFLSWIELMLLILSHPITSVQISMFKAVAWNSFKFLLCYLTLIVAFALSYYQLFKDTGPEFKDIALAMLKTSVMSTGEFEMSNKLFDSEFGISHLLFILFIFLVPIVLFNLLNGVAIGDIQGIRNNAELVSTVARVKLIAHMEEIISDLLDLLSFLGIHDFHCNAPGRGYKCPQYYQFVDLFAVCWSKKVYITPNQNNTISMDARTIYRIGYPIISSIPASTIDAIKEKLSQRAGNVEVSHGQGIPEVSQAVTNLQKECKNLSIQQQNTSEKLRIIKQELAEIKKLLREKL